MLNWQFITTTLYLYGILMTMGLISSARSVTMPIIMKQFSLSYDKEGIAVSSLSFVGIISSAIATIILKYVSHKTEIIMSWVIVACGTFITALINSVYGAIGGLLVLSFGFAILQISCNSFSSIFFVKNKGIWVNIEHGIYGVGCIIGPILGSYFSYNLRNSYRSTYLIFAISSIIIAFLICFGKFKKIEYNQVPITPQLSSQPSSLPTELPELSIVECLKDKLVWIYTITLGIECNIEIAATNWAVLYIEDVLHLSSKKEGSIFMTVFYILFTVSRLITGGIIQKIGYVNSLLISILGSLILFTIGFIFINKTGMIILIGTGFFLAPFWPTLMCSIMEVYESQSSTPTSIIICIEGILVVSTNYFQGLINEKVGKAWGYRSTVPLCVLTFILLLFVKRMSNNRINQRKNLINRIEEDSIEMCDIDLSEPYMIGTDINCNDKIDNFSTPKVKRQHVDLVKVYSSSSSEEDDDDDEKDEKEETAV